MKRKTLIITTIAVLSILCAIILILGAVLWLRAARSGEIKFTAPEAASVEKNILGDLTVLNLYGELPWGQYLTASSCIPGEGTVLSGQIAVRKQASSLNGQKLQLSIPLKSYRTGSIPSGKVSLTIERPFFRKGPRKITREIPLPALQVSDRTVKDRNQLPLADQLQPPEVNYSRSNWIMAGAVLLLLAIILILWLRFRSKNAPQRILPPWEIARKHLTELRQTANDGKRPLEWCVAQLTDVVRDYLSIRFNWPVRQQTTAEFFASLKHKKTPLTTQQIRYLEDFLTSADLVKFANIRPDQNEFDQAVDHAEGLVIATTAENNPLNPESAENRSANNLTGEEI